MYHRGVDTILHHFLTHDEAEQVLDDCHSGASSGHLSGLDTAQKIIHNGYFWPTIFVDCVHAVKHCCNFQLFSRKVRTPPTLLHIVVTVGPFYKWAIDFMTCNPTSIGSHKYIIMDIDYFTKLAKAMPTFNCKANTAARSFLTTLSHVLVSPNK